MSSNAFRALKKKIGRAANGKKVDKPPKDGACTRKAYPTVTAPEPSKGSGAVSTQAIRKSSLSADSPVHSAAGRVPTSPLVISKSSTHLGRRDSNPSLPGAISQLPPSLPKVSVGAYDDQPLDRQGIINITVDVQNFLAAISRLRKAMEEAEVTESEDPSVGAQLDDPEADTSPVMSNLRDLIQVVHQCLGQHQGMQSTEIKNAAKNLMNCHRTCNHRNTSTCSSCNAAIETLIDAFTNSVQEYLTGETVPQETLQQPPQHHRRLTGGFSSTTNLLKGFSKSHENLAPRYSSYIDLSQQFNEPIVDQIDQALLSIKDSVDAASRYIKVRMKYHREMTSYLAKRAQIEARYQQQVSKLAKSTKMALDELQAQEDCLPFVELFRTSVDQDLKFATNCNTTYNFQVGNKLVEPLEQKIGECERVKKDLTQTWQRERKKLAEARTSMKNAKAKYRFLAQDFSKVKNLLAADPYGKQADKRKKEVGEVEAKWQEAETAYKNAVAECNDCQYQVHAVAQKSILCAYRRVVIDFDIALKSGLETYFQLQHNFFRTLPDPMHQNLLETREYEVGSEFMRYIQRQTEDLDEPEDYHFEEFDPDADLGSSGAAETSPETLTDFLRLPTSSSSDSPFLSTEDPIRRTERAPSPQLMQAWDPDSQPLNDSLGSGSSPSPHSSRRKPRPRSMAFLLEPNFESPKNTFPRRNSSDQAQQQLLNVTSPQVAGAEEPIMSKIAHTHSFKKLRGPARCRECDTYVYFHGSECDRCGLACHKKCLAALAIRCGSRRLARKMNTFGVDFHKHLRATKRFIPIIVTKCINEIDERGLNTQGLYRISSAKPKIEYLCQLFESGADRVDLSDRPCHLIGACLKLYFRQLPEPLLTFGLYHEFLTFAREASHILPCHFQTASEDKAALANELLDRLKGLLQKLPYENYITLARLLYHLNRVGSPEHSKHNCMPPSNLGIVFGPNLLRLREAVPSLALLADMTALAKATEILISHVHDVFHVSEEQIVTEVEQEYDDSETTERLVGDAVETAEILRSPQLDVDENHTAGSRTPYNTPPEKRRENVSELGEVLEVLQSVSTTRRLTSRLSVPTFRKATLSDTHEHPTFSSSLPLIPGTLGSEDILSSLHRFLRPQAMSPPIFDKMLTPVEERPTEVENEDMIRSEVFSEDEDDLALVSSTSHKIDGSVLSRSTSGLSNPSSLGVGGDLESEVSSVRDLEPEESSMSNLSTMGSTAGGILLGGFSTPPKAILSKSHSMDMPSPSYSGQSQPEESDEHFKEAITQILSDENSKEGPESSQGSDDSSTFSDNVKALMDRESPPTSPRGILSLSRSREGTPRRRHLSSDSSYPPLNLASPRHVRPRRPSPRYTAEGFMKPFGADLYDSSHSSSHSSISRTSAKSSQGSFSETLGEEITSSRDSSLGSFNKYRRYQHDRSLDEPLEQESDTRRMDDASSASTSENSNMDSVVTTATLVATNGTSDTTDDANSDTTKCQSQDSQPETDDVFQNGRATEKEGEEADTPQLSQEKKEGEGNGGDKSEEESDFQKAIEERWRTLKEANHQTDSGIEESSVSETKTDSGIIETPTELDDDANEDVPLPDESKPLRSYTALFTSRESGLADSPDPYSEEQPKPDQKLPDAGYRKTSFVELFIPPNGEPPKLISHRISQFSLDSDGNLDIGPTIMEYSEDDRDFERSRKESIESNLDRYPRHPSKYDFKGVQTHSVSSQILTGYHEDAVTNPLYESTRTSESLSHLVNSFRSDNPPERGDHRQEDPSSIQRLPGEGPRYVSPRPRTDDGPRYVSPRPRSQTDLGPRYVSSYPQANEEQRYVSPPIQRSPKREPRGTIHSEASSTGTNNHYSVPTHRPRKLDARGTTDPEVRGRSTSYDIPRRSKPALRVLRITPSSSAHTNSEQHKDSGPRIDSPQAATVDVRDSDSNTLEIQTARLRMMSPEAMAIPPLPSKSTLKRSQSHELLENTTDCIDPATKVGTVFVVPEIRPGRKNMKISVSSPLVSSPKDSGSKLPALRPQPHSATVLVDVDRNRRVSLDAVGSSSSDGNPRSPRNKKRSRIPHFV